MTPEASGREIKVALQQLSTGRATAAIGKIYRDQHELSHGHLPGQRDGSIGAYHSGTLQWRAYSSPPRMSWKGEWFVPKQEHAEVVDRLAARDGAGAARAMDRHIEKRAGQNFGSPSG